METITLNIKKEFLQAIMVGAKKVEYRDVSVSLLNKLKKLNDIPFHLRLINGMTKNAPEATVLVTKLLEDLMSGQYEFHIDTVITSKNCDALLRNMPDFAEDNNLKPEVEISSKQFKALKKGECNSFALEDTKEVSELLESLLPLPRWVALTSNGNQMDAIVSHILGNYFQPQFEIRVLQKPE